MEYIKQLDSLRGIAVLMVIVHHWIPESIINIIPNGIIGVWFFFVLSGFLISNILFLQKKEYDENRKSWSSVIKNFYVRRSLRIFPIYYLTVILLIVFASSTGTSIGSSWGYFLTYTSNFYFFKTQQWDGMISHLWTLAVEEQFYLIWPFLVLFVNKKNLSLLIAIFILTGVVTEYILIPNPMGNILTFSCFHAFGLGGLLAWVRVYKLEDLGEFYIYLSYTAIALSAIYIIQKAGFLFELITVRTLIAIVSTWLIGFIILNPNSKNIGFKLILNSSFLIFLGKISYGIYLFHNIVPYLTQFIRISLSLDDSKLIRGQYFVENFIFLILLAWISFNVIEKPFLNVKKHFVS
jgi:peptidoglycan/LPS O-acetylase OafA/YrhL